MPQLPSGRHVGFTIGVAREKIKADDFTAWLAYTAAVNSIEDMKSIVNIVYYKSENESPSVDDPSIGEPYISELVIADIGTDKCAWSEEDQSAFLDIIKSPRVCSWIQASYEELAELIEQCKPKLPDNLKAIFEDE